MANSLNLFYRTGARKNSREGESIIVSGFKEIDQVLREFPRKVAIPVVVATMSAGLQEAVRGIRRAVPPATTKGHNTRSIKRSVGRSPNRVIRRLAKGYRAVAKVGIGVGAANKKQVKHAQAYVAGTAPRFRAAKGGPASTGAVKGTPIVDLGIAASQSRILAAMQRKGRKAFDRTVSRLTARLIKQSGRNFGAALRGVLS